MLNRGEIFAVSPDVRIFVDTEKQSISYHTYNK